MLGHLLATFGRLFASRRSRVAVVLLIVVSAALPVCEMLVLRLFSSLILDGPERFTHDRTAAIVNTAIFLLAFGLARATHHLVRLRRVRVFRDSFDASGRIRNHSQESWEWAMAFELSAVLVSLVQVVTFSVLFLFVDWPTAALNAIVSLVVLLLVSVIYRRQLDLQMDYVKMGSRPGTVAVAQRVGGRIRDAEIGSILASAGMTVVLVAMVFRTLSGSVGPADAIVLFLGLRLLSGQLGVLSASIMRFARALARRGDD